MDLRKLWPTLIPVVAVLITSFSDVITGWLSSNPTVALLVTTLVTAIANITKSPTQKS